MDGITFVLLGSQGTYGHLAIADKISRFITTQDLNIDVNLLLERQVIPDEFRQNFSQISWLEPRPHTCSRGGSLNTKYAGADVDRALEEHSGRTWVFSTFFDCNLVQAVQTRGGRCVWMSHPIRESFWQLFLHERFCDLFDEIVFLDDIMPADEIQYLGPKPKILPPPDYAYQESSLEVERRTLSKFRVVLCCGGGLVNGSDDLLRSCLESIAATQSCAFTDVDFEIAPGAIDSLEWINGLALNTAVVRSSLRERMCDADFLICQAGYCTVHEAVHAALPMMLIPAPRMIDDQELRAVGLSRSVGIETILPSHINDVGTHLDRAIQKSNEVLPSLSKRLRSYTERRGWDEYSARSQWSALLNEWTDESDSRNEKKVSGTDSVI